MDDFNYIIHIVIAVVALIGASTVGIALTTSQIIFCILGSVLPDIDHHHSLIGRYNPFARIMIHRGFTHTLVASALFSIIGLWDAAYFATLAGYLSHIAGDYVSSGGQWKVKII